MGCHAGGKSGGASGTTPPACLPAAVHGIVIHVVVSAACILERLLQQVSTALRWQLYGLLVPQSAR